MAGVKRVEPLSELADLMVQKNTHLQAGLEAITKFAEVSRDVLGVFEVVVFPPGFDFERLRLLGVKWDNARAQLIEFLEISREDSYKLHSILKEIAGLEE